MWESSLRFVGALWNVVGILLAAILVVELGVPWARRALRRLRYGRGGKPNTRAAAEAYAGAAWPYQYHPEIERLLAFEGAPFVHWKQRPCRGVYTSVDARGCRVVPGADAAGEGALRVHCFGGSTMFGLGARDEGTIPAALQRRLRAAGHRVALANYGQCSYTSTQELILLLQSLKQGERPDVALFYDGVNDLFTTEWRGRPDTIMNEDLRSAEFNLLGKERRRELLRAAVLGAMPRTLRYLRKWLGIDVRGPAPPLEFVRLREAELVPLAEALVAAYATNVRTIRSLARAYGFQVLFVWQPILSSKKTKSADEQKWDGAITADAALRRRFLAAVVAALGRSPALKEAPDLIDLSALFDDEARPVYIDYCHLNEEANASVAEAILPALAAAVTAAAAPRRADPLSQSGARR